MGWPPSPRHNTAVALIATMSIIGGWLPASAAAEGPLALRRPLVLNGRPLSHALYSSTAWDTRLLENVAVGEGGQIAGVALDAERKPLANHRLSLRNVSGSAPVEAITDAAGRFTFVALSPGRYVIDVLVEGQVIASSGAITVAAGGMTLAEIGGVTEPASTAKGQRGKGVLFWTAVGAGAGGAAGLIAISGADCDRAENMCPAAPIMGGIVGALFGFLFGLER
jgi:hypothetical protein